MEVLAFAFFFLVNAIFFIWFGATLNSINERLGTIASHAENQTKLLAALAKGKEVAISDPPAAQADDDGRLDALIAERVDRLDALIGERATRPRPIL